MASQVHYCRQKKDPLEVIWRKLCSHKFYGPNSHQGWCSHKIGTLKTNGPHYKFIKLSDKIYVRTVEIVKMSSRCVRHEINFPKY
jgi:hypothetical protein